MKYYRQGDECVFPLDSEEYALIKSFAEMLATNSPNEHVYVVKDVYLDFGQDWKWTTIVDETANCQVLSPNLWLRILNNGYEGFNELMIEFFNGTYCQDTYGFPKRFDKVVLKFGYTVDILEDQRTQPFHGADVNNGNEITFRPYDIEEIIKPTQFVLRSYYDEKLRGLEDSIELDWGEDVDVNEWIWEKCSQGNYVQLRDLINDEYHLYRPVESDDIDVSDLLIEKTTF